MMNTRDPTSRLRANLNPLRTSSLGVGAYHASNTPVSAMSMASHTTIQTPASAIQPYNPQQWMPSPAPGRDHGHYQEPPESSPPPPPYSPPRSQRPISVAYETPPANISAARAPLPAGQRPSPESMQSFAPPPGGSRGLSRERRFGLPTFGRRRESDQQLPHQSITMSPSDMHGVHGSHAPPPPPPPLSRSPQPLPMNTATSPTTPHRANHPMLQPLQIPNSNIQGAMVPPSSRRAASTGAIATPTSARSRSASQVRWEPGMPLPPPPPGPPPSGSRSQSMQRPPSGSEPIASPPTRRPPPAGVAVLGPVPPTPAGWFDQDALTPQGQSAGQASLEVAVASPPASAPPVILASSSATTPAATAAGEPSPNPSSSHMESESSVVSSSRDTAAESAASSTPDSNNSMPSPGMVGNLSRNGAVRGEKTLRERRNESRTRGGIRDSIDGVAGSGRQLSNIVIPSPTGIGSVRRQGTASASNVANSGANKATPRSGGFSAQLRDDLTPRTGDTPAIGMGAGTATPPFSPNSQKPRVLPMGSGKAVATDTQVPQALPTPPTQSRSNSASQPRISTDALAGGGTPSSPVVTTKELAVKQTADQFSVATIDRYHAFAQREAVAASDAERVRLFAEFVVNESRVRRERYAAAIGAMGSEIFDLTRDLFRPMTTPIVTTGINRNSQISHESSSAGGYVSAVEFTPQSSAASRSHCDSASSSALFRDASSVSTSAPASSTFPPNSASKASDTSEGSSVLGMSPTVSSSRDWQQAANATNNFMPSLSPILSMSVSENHDDDSSRGRTASRWWESSSHGESAMRLERSRRESKYMGVGKEAREALQWTDNPEPLSGKSVLSSGGMSGNYSNLNGSSMDPGVGSSSGHQQQQPRYYGPNEYPPEKVPEGPLLTPQAVFRNSLVSMTSSAPNTPGATQLDVSRLVTLPPPYPRHHPAVNNNHPELAAMRSSVRTLSNMEPVDAARTKFADDNRATNEEADRTAQKEQQAMRARLHTEISAGRMSYADAAAVEAEASEAAKARTKAQEKAEFDRFQTTVVMPVNELLTARITQATQVFDELRGRLFVETRQASPNMPQEEGDEQPELLETLTLLKWIFEAREALHRAIYDLLTDRNNRYRDMVLTPYRLSGNEEKLANAVAFFEQDATTRVQAFAEESLKRTQEFRDVIEENVVRGVEVQLSAFWDIAPPLNRLIDQIPGGAALPAMADLSGFQIRIPAAEYDENPIYHQHPLQYLFSLLLHAEKSTHQFIESQTNLFCLLHEVKEAVVAAKTRVLEAEGRDPRQCEAQAAEERARLTEDLQDKVRVVQDQWKSALGDGIVLVKERVGGFLLETGGWDETLEEGGVGSV